VIVPASLSPEVDQLLPVFTAVDYNQDLLRHFLGLRQRGISKLVEVPTLGKNHQCLSQMGKPNFRMKKQ
jgi:hypothetical protein